MSGKRSDSTTTVEIIPKCDGRKGQLGSVKLTCACHTAAHNDHQYFDTGNNEVRDDKRYTYASLNGEGQHDMHSDFYTTQRCFTNYITKKDVSLFRTTAECAQKLVQRGIGCVPPFPQWRWVAACQLLELSLPCTTIDTVTFKSYRCTGTLRAGSECP